MKFLLLLIVFVVTSANVVSAQGNGDCGGMVTGMNVTTLSSTGLHIQFFRPLSPEKYWSHKDIPEYENNFTIIYKPYFSQSENAYWIKDVDTSAVEHSFQITANEHSSSWDLISLMPGTSYEVCLYTRCGNDKVGPLCHFGNTSTEAPCKLELSSTGNGSASISFKYKPNTNILPKKIIFQYREKKEDWQEVEPSSSLGAYLTDLKAGETYFARVKFVYYNDVESNFSDELIFFPIN